MKVLVFSPHGDDEVLGCGGTIARYTKEKNKVDLCILTEPCEPKWSREYIEKRTEEIYNSKSVLGINGLYLLGLPTANMTEHSNFYEIIDMVVDIITISKPDIVFIPYHGDMHQDHKTTFEVCMIAMKICDMDIQKVLCYETLSESEYGISEFKPNTYIDITKYIDKKIKAIGCYDSELKSHPYPRSISSITALARKRGSEINKGMAEGFILIREII